MAQTVFEELVEAIRSAQSNFADQRANESENDFLKRLIKGATELSDKQWETLSEATQAWVNSGIEASNKGQAIAGCPGYQTAFPDMPQKEVVAKPAATTSGASRRGVMKRARQLALLNPTWKFDDVMKALAAEGFDKVSENTAYVCVDEVKNVLAAAQEIGLTLSKPEPVEVAG